MELSAATVRDLVKSLDVDYAVVIVRRGGAYDIQHAGAHRDAHVEAADLADSIQLELSDDTLAAGSAPRARAEALEAALKESLALLATVRRTGSVYLVASAIIDEKLARWGKLVAPKLTLQKSA